MKYLIFAKLSDAQARSQQRAQAAKCVAPTLYWWDVQVNPDGRGAVAVADIGAFDKSGMTTIEQTALVPTLDATWTPVSVA